MEDRKQSVVVRMREFLAARPRLRLAGGLVAVAVLVLLLAPNPDKPGVHQTGHPVAPSWGGANGEASPREGDRVGENNVKEMASLPAPPGISSEFYKQVPNLGGSGAMSEPRIAYSAELSMVTKEFAHSRASLEEILERHRGYTARLRMVGQPSGSVLTALLRVPSSEYRSALTELKGVGVLEHEEEAADEITSHPLQPAHAK